MMSRRLPILPPLVSGIAMLWLSQMAGLLLYSFGTDPSGHALQVSPLNALMISVPLYTSRVLEIAVVLFTLWIVLRPLRGIVSVAGVTGCAVLIVITHVDFGMQRLRGERLSLAQVSIYSSGNLINGDWLRPVIERPAAIILSLSVLVVSLVLLGLLVVARRGASSRQAVIGWRAVVGCAFGAVLCSAPLNFAYYHQRDMAEPPEYVLLREARARPATTTAAAQREMRDALRQRLDPRGTSHWISDEFPLERTVATAPSATASAAELPDIIFFVIESLRARDVGYGLTPRAPGKSVTPNLDSLAARAVVFPRYIASGEPSPRGFITINTGGWEHNRQFIIADFPNFTTDAIPLRLRALGYHTMALWGGNPSFDNQLTWARRWYDEQLFDQPVNRLFYFKTMPDHLLMDRFIDRVRAHDATEPAQPIFAYVASNGTHTPYDLEDGAAVPADLTPSEDRQRRYDLALENIDAQIGRVLRFLDSRPRARNTVIVVTGDHSDRTTEQIDERWRGMPVDPFVHTAAILYGPERLVGAPRREEFTASHVDLMPTILAITNDTGPTATLGQNLLAAIPVGQRFSVSINSRGYRLDENGYTLLVAPDDPARAYAFKSFPDGVPHVVPLAETPFRADEPKRLIDMLGYWSSLVEQNRVWNPALSSFRIR
jgi:hypothetical protein